MKSPPIREGHFVLESGLHTDCWYELDTLFVDGDAIAPSIHRLADLLRPFAPTAVCGPFDGGAFVALKLARRLELPCFYTRRVDTPGAAGLFATQYALPPGQRSQIAGHRVALVDDMISAGSATRASRVALDNSGATVAVVGALFLSGSLAETHFGARGIPVVAVEHRAAHIWPPASCPACRAGTPITPIES